MEAAGLAIGAVALVSLFKDCIDLYSMISAARKLDEDASILNIKLGVEKMLLLQWSDRVGLLEPVKFDTTFNDITTRETILSILSSIKSLLSNAQALQDTYGLVKHSSLTVSPASDSTPTEQFNEASENRLSRFLGDFNKFKATHSGESIQPSRVHKAAKQFRWVVVYKDKFDGLINHLSYFNGALNSLTPRVSDSTFDLSSEDLSYVDSISHLDGIIQISVKQHPAIAKAAMAAKRNLIRRRILLRLSFARQDDRKDNIKNAHHKTLSWALTRLSPWLLEGSGIYWIFGKAGSGKSTLMKYLAYHKDAYLVLDRWACGTKLIICNFFFYALGQTEQRSQMGLLRSLLYQILMIYPEYIEVVLSNMWQEVLLSGDKSEDHPQNQQLSMLSANQLMIALSTLCKTHLRDTKFCFFIDGLDEFEGQDMDSAAFIEELGSFPNTKVIVSSRPHPAFVALFSTKPRMNLPDLTKDDILSYIEGTVGSHPYLSALSRIQPDVKREIVRLLADKASGVFLWVALACRSVLEGCHNYDTIEDIKARTEALPGEVERLFEQLLTTIQPCWRGDAVRTLKMVHTNDCYRESEPIPTLGLYLAQEQGLDVTSDQSRTTFVKISTLTRHLDVIHEITEGRIRSRYCGLIEVSNEGAYITVIHRSLHSFLSQPGVWERISTSIEETEIDGHAMLSALWLRMSGSAATTTLVQRKLMENAMAHIYYGAKDTCAPEVTLHNLSKLQFIMGMPESGSLWAKARYCLLHVPTCRRYCDDVSLALPLAVEMGLVQVVKYALEQTAELPRLLTRASRHQPSLLDCNDTGSESTFTYRGSRCKSQGQFHEDNDEKRLTRTVYPLLYHALCRPLVKELSSRGCSIQKVIDRDPSSDMVQYILAQGYSPNESFLRLKYSKDTTPWREWIKNADLSRNTCYSVTQRSSQVTMAMIDAGADIQGLESAKLSEFMYRVEGYCQIPSQLTTNDNPTNQRLWLDVRRTIVGQLHNDNSSQDNLKREGPLNYTYQTPAVRTFYQVTLAILFFYLLCYYI